VTPESFLDGFLLAFGIVALVAAIWLLQDGEDA
jgi:hypothetical protein